MKILLGAIILIALCYLAYQVFRINSLRNIASELVAETIPFQQSPDDPARTILIVGDSLQAGVGASAAGNSMAGLLGASYPSWQIINQAESGFETAGALNKLQKSDINDVDLAIVQIGANDIFHLSNLKQATDNLRQLLTLAKDKSDEVIFMTSGSVGYAPLFPMPADWFYTTRSQKFIAEYFRVANELDVPVVDNFRSREDDLFEQNPDKYYAADKFHLSDAGYQVWYERLQDKLRELNFTQNPD
jgi:lysophospholipase L1-like esterase